MSNLPDNCIQKNNKNFCKFNIKKYNKNRNELFYIKKLKKMTNIKTLASNIPNYANDIKQNVAKFLSENNPLLSPKQVFGSALAAAYTAKEKSAINDLENEARFHLSKTEMQAVKTAASVATMNNIYRNFVLAMNDNDYENIDDSLATANADNHSIDKIDFEVFSLAASIINTCKKSIDFHAIKLVDFGLSKQQIQMIAKIVATVGAAAQVLQMEEVIS